MWVVSRSNNIFIRHKFILFVSVFWYFRIFLLSLFSLLQKLLLLLSDLIEWIWIFLQIFCILNLTCRYLLALTVSFLLHLRNHCHLFSKLIYFFENWWFLFQLIIIIKISQININVWIFNWYLIILLFIVITIFNVFIKIYTVIVLRWVIQLTFELSIL